MFMRRPRELPIPETNRVVLIVGGSGTFGAAILAAKPAETFVVNVSRSRTAKDADANCRFDLAREPGHAFRHLARLLPFIDVFIYAAYSRDFAPIDRIERRRFLREYELNVYTAIECMRLCGQYFWKGNKEDNRARARKTILISSAAGLGKTARPELASYGATKAALNLLGPYAHDYMYATYGASVAVLAPGSLSNPATREKCVSRFWEIQAAPIEQFLLETVV